MMFLDGLPVDESWTEYGVEVEPGLTVDCDDQAEAILIASNFGAKVLERRGFLTEYRVAQLPVNERRA